MFRMSGWSYPDGNKRFMYLSVFLWSDWLEQLVEIRLFKATDTPIYNRVATWVKAVWNGLRVIQAETRVNIKNVIKLRAKSHFLSCGTVSQRSHPSTGCPTGKTSSCSASLFIIWKWRIFSKHPPSPSWQLLSNIVDVQKDPCLCWREEKTGCHGLVAQIAEICEAFISPRLIQYTLRNRPTHWTHSQSFNMLWSFSIHSPQTARFLHRTLAGSVSPLRYVNHISPPASVRRRD